MPTALCFDAFGTLYDTESPVVRLREHVDAPAGVIDDVVALWRSKQLQYSYLVALMDDYRPFDAVTADALDYALDYYGIDLASGERETVAGAYDALDPFPDTVSALERLAETDLRLAVLSNGAPHSLESLAEGAGIEERFSALISADEVETFKPDPAVYENAARRLDLPLSECWLVSSNAWDAAGAANAGMGVAWVNRAGDPPERVGGAADLVVDSLEGLADELADG